MKGVIMEVVAVAVVFQPSLFDGSLDGSNLQAIPFYGVDDDSLLTPCSLLPRPPSYHCLLVRCPAECVRLSASRRCVLGQAGRFCGPA